MKEWTSGRLHSFIVASLRSGMRRYPPKFEALNKAKRGKKVNPETGRIAEHYECNSCHMESVKKLVQVDHIEPIVNSSGFTTWDEYIKRLFCSVDNLQVLCKECHKIKTNKERKMKV